MLPTFINKLLQGHHLTETEAESAMEVIMTGNATPAQIGGYLIALRMKGETVGEITGSARAIRAQASRVIIPPNGPLLDTAGTGGDGADTFNASTTAAFIIRARAARWPSTAIGPPHQNAAAPTCWPRSATTST